MVDIPSASGMSSSRSSPKPTAGPPDAAACAAAESAPFPPFDCHGAQLPMGATRTERPRARRTRRALPKPRGPRHCLSLARLGGNIATATCSPFLVRCAEQVAAAAVCEADHRPELQRVTQTAAVRVPHDMPPAHGEVRALQPRGSKSETGDSGGAVGERQLQPRCSLRYLL